MQIKDEPATFLKGEKVILRLLSKKDINSRYLAWLNNQEVNKYMEAGDFPVSLKELKDYYNKVANSKNNIIFAILDKRKNLHIGNIKLGSINWIHRFADLGIMIGDNRYWGKSYGNEACQLLLKYAFYRLNLNKILLGVSEEHRFAIRAYKKVGFKIEGRLRKMINSSGKYVDKILMGILREDFKQREK